MRRPEARFRVETRTPSDAPNNPEHFVKEWRDGAWRLVIHDGMWICFNDRAKAERVAAKLEAGQDITEDMRRVPVRWYERPEGYDPSARSPVAHNC